MSISNYQMRDENILATITPKGSFTKSSKQGFIPPFVRHAAKKSDLEYYLEKLVRNYGEPTQLEKINSFSK